jgi:membrane-bound lytic murein transglycosylase B
MDKPPLLLFVGFGYLFYRYSSTDIGDAALIDDVVSTMQTVKEWAVQTDIPFGCVDPQTKRDYKDDIKSAARLSGVPALLLASLIRQESGFKATVRNTNSGAMGLGQFMPATAAEWFGATWQNGVYDPDRAIPMTARYLAWLYRRHGTWRLAVGAYNWGTGNIAKKGLALAPKETRDYVRIVYDTWASSLPA